MIYLNSFHEHGPFNIFLGKLVINLTVPYDDWVYIECQTPDDIKRHDQTNQATSSRSIASRFIGNAG